VAVGPGGGVTPPRMSLVRPTRATEASKARARIEAGEARRAVNLTAAQHRAVKMRAAELGLSIRDYIVSLLERDSVW
jgi:predicted DNA binding CopG/RHH family protein